MPSTGTLAPGTLISGRYRVASLLGGEASAAVYLAADTRLERTVALRVLALAGAGPGALQGAAAARLAHPNLAPVLDSGTDAEAGLHFVACEADGGGTLAALLAQRGTPPLALGLRMLREAAAGMAAAHAAGLAHGDLHPGLLWLSRSEGRLRLRVLGMGLDPSGTRPPRASARWASPERLRAGALGPAADVFSLGAIAFEVLAGLPEDWTAHLIAMARGQAAIAPSPAEARPDLPPALAHAVRRALAADPAARWTDARELAAQLGAVPAPVSAASPPVAPPAAEEAPRLAALPEQRPAVATTDLADTLYIPPAPAKPAPPPTVAASAPAPAPVAPVLAAPPVPSAPVPPVRRRPGMERLGRPPGSRRGLLAAAVVAVLLAGGAAGRALLAGPGTASADTGALAARALIGSAPEAVEGASGTPATTPEPAAAAETPARTPIAAGPPPAAASPTATDDTAVRQREAERERADAERRERAREDSLRAAPPLAGRPVGEAVAPPPAAPRALAQPSAPAARIQQSVDAPAARAAPDPDRVYGNGEVDRAPALANARQFQSAVQRTYPSALRGTGTAGRAVVSFVVLADGRVDRSSITVGDLSNPAFRSAAVAAANAARFTPAMAGGRAVRARVSVPLSWQAPERE